ncbi:WXG100 family type VII secretion target [Gordonia amicalis]|uniref:WXG100 family type VII secretion target n=1 Tax=Gordonia amicalis TaxID=89053 RepID=UPI002953B32A|nr:WXG100 family type VII secretion target [Gordonia amicalis]MDV7171936.1 WXG100 family type VII secretion target [Gordonia amicalis]
MTHHSTPDDGYTVDLTQLDEATDRIATFVQRLTDLMEEVDTTVVKRCAEVWGGVGSEAYQERQRNWASAMTKAQGEVEEMRIAARLTHSNYSSAKAANLAMLGR